MKDTLNDLLSNLRLIGLALLFMLCCSLAIAILVFAWIYMKYVIMSCCGLFVLYVLKKIGKWVDKEFVNP